MFCGRGGWGGGAWCARGVGVSDGGHTGPAHPGATHRENQKERETGFGAME